MPIDPTIPPVLTLFRTAQGEYALRLFDLADQALAAGITKLVPDMRRLLLITPSDMKAFDFVPDGAEPEEGIPQSTMDPMEEAAMIAGEPEAVKVESVPKSTRRRKANASIAGHEDTCSRCRGKGIVPILMDGGQAAEGSCPVCQGKGTITRYGSRTR